MRYFIEKVEPENGKSDQGEGWKKLKLLWREEMEVIDGNHKMTAREVFDPPLSFEERSVEEWDELNSSKGGNE